MNLDRALIKSQAKQIIKGNVFKLFLICLVVLILTGNIFTIVQNVSNGVDNPYSYGSISDFDDFYNYSSHSASNSFVPALGGIWSFAGIFLAPLTIGLCALFLALIRGNNKTLSDGFSYVFKTAFDKAYLQKVLMLLLIDIVTFLLALLFLIPGIIYSLKVRFAKYIIADNPNFTWKESVELSKKMTNGHKGEIFTLILSFIPWYLLVSITCGLAGIYFIPYMSATMALYFENFKQRGLQTGELNPNDFVSNAERAAFNPYQNAGGYQPPQAAPYQQSVQQPAQPAQPAAPIFNEPAQPQYQPPQEQYYQPPAQPAQPAAPIFNEPAQPQYQPPQEQYYQPPAQPSAPTFNEPAQTPQSDYYQPSEDSYYQPPSID